MRTIVAICGRKQSGKDTIAELLCEKGFKRFSLASKLKEIARDLFNVDVAEKHGPIPEEDRKVLQKLSHQLRDMDSDVWISYLFKQIKKEPKDAKVCVSDVRYVNELFKFKHCGEDVILWRLKRRIDNDTHASEVELDTIPDSEFDIVFDNQDWTYEEFKERAQKAVDEL